MAISVEHGHARVTLAVPADVPVETLLPLLVDACGADDGATWTLVPRGGEPVGARRTLREAGVPAGAILTLRMAGPGEQRPPAPVRSAGTAGLPGRPPRWRAAEYLADLERRVGAAAPRPGAGVVVAVVSIAPGCGKTTVASLLAMVLARALPEPPLAVDADLASRSLSRLLAPHRGLSQETYAGVVGGRLRPGELPRTAPGAYGLALLPAPAHPSPPLDAAACAAFAARLRAEWAVTLLDCPAGFATAWSQAAWAAADQFVLVADDGPADLADLAAVASTLAAGGASVAVVANRARRRGRRARAAAAEGLQAPVVGVPDDEAAAAALREGVLTWAAAPAAWRLPVAELAAALSTHWPREGHDRNATDPLLAQHGAQLPANVPISTAR